jgi:hypothetical protein
MSSSFEKSVEGELVDEKQVDEKQVDEKQVDEKQVDEKQVDEKQSEENKAEEIQLPLPPSHECVVDDNGYAITTVTSKYGKTTFINCLGKDVWIEFQDALIPLKASVKKAVPQHQEDLFFKRLLKKNIFFDVEKGMLVKRGTFDQFDVEGVDELYPMKGIDFLIVDRYCTMAQQWKANASGIDDAVSNAVSPIYSPANGESSEEPVVVGFYGL